MLHIVSAICGIMGYDSIFPFIQEEMLHIVSAICGIMGYDSIFPFI